MPATVCFCLPIVFFILAMTVTLPVFAEPQLVMGVDRTSIDEGESIDFQIMLSDDRPIDDGIVPDTSGLTDFDVRALPVQRQTLGGGRHVVQIQGQIVRDETTPTTHVIRFSYLLTPKKSGSLAIPFPKVIVDGKPLTPSGFQADGRLQPVPPGGTIPVTVRPPDVQDDVLLQIETNRSRLYPLQPLSVTLVVRIRELPGRLADRNPMSIPDRLPRLVIPWAETDAQLPKGLKPRETDVDWLNSLLVQRNRDSIVGFAINDHGRETFSMGFDDDWFNSPLSQRSLIRKVPYQFLPPAKKVRHRDFSGSEATYWEYRFSRTFFPEELGSYRFGPVSLKGVFPVADPAAQDGVSLKSIYAMAPAVEVEAVDVPRDERPDDYIGAFGTFDWKVELEPRKARVGQPLQLSLSLVGPGSTANVSPPDLSRNPEIAAAFRTTYPPSEKLADNACTFEYTIRPTRSGTFSFPSLSVTCFDVEKEEFVTLRSEPISLEVEASSITDVPSIYTGGRPSGDLELSERGIFANMTDPKGAVDQSVDYRRLLEILLALVAGYLVLVLVVVLRRRSGAHPGRLRRRGAPTRARRRLTEIARELQDATLTPEQALLIGGRLQGILFGYVADLTDGIEEGMTTADACVKLVQLGASPETVDRTRVLLETLDAARYGGLDLRSLDEMAEQADRILKNLQTEIPLY